MLSACKKDVPIPFIPQSESTAPAEALPVPTETVPLITIFTHEEFLAAPANTQVWVDAYVQAVSRWENNRISFFAQDADGGYLIRDAECDSQTASLLTPGTALRIFGTKSEQDGALYISHAGFTPMAGSYIAGAFDVTDLLGKEALQDHQNEKVSFSGLTIEPSDNRWSAFTEAEDGSLLLCASIGEQTYPFVVDCAFTDRDSDAYVAVQQLLVGNIVRMEGYLQFENGRAFPRIVSIQSAVYTGNAQ